MLITAKIKARCATLYVGANNTTGYLETRKARTIVGRYFRSFSYSQVNGCWLSGDEPALKIEIVTQESMETVFLLADELREELQQHTVMLWIGPGSLMLFSGSVHHHDKLVTSHV